MTKLNLRSLAFKIAAVLACAALCACTTVSAGAQENPIPSGLVKGNIYYLSVYKDGQPPYLYPISPQQSNLTSIFNKVTVKANSSEFFAWPREYVRSYEDHYVKDRPDLWPRISVVVNSGGMPGKSLRFEIWFDLDGAAKNEADVEAKALFDDYTTKSSNTTELIDMKAKSISGTLGDLNFGTVKLVVWRLDGQNDDMFIYCGAFNSTSWMVIPYQFEPYDGSDTDDDTDGPGVYVAVGILAIGLVIFIAIIIIYYRKRSQQPDGGDDEDEEEEEDPEEKKHRRRNEKRRRTAAFYRKNR